MSEENKEQKASPNSLSDNLYIYDTCAKVPESAQKTIGAGRLKGMTDINPMWRIQVLTQMFGPCGQGWRYTIERQWLESGSDGSICAFCNISLYTKTPEGDWSFPIPGTGGSSYVAKEKSGLYTSDEAFKMALTDAISVACKALGVGADVYWKGGKDSKYSAIREEEYKCVRCGKPFEEYVTKANRYLSPKQMYHISEGRNGVALCGDCVKAVKETMAEAERKQAEKQADKQAKKEQEEGVNE